jgi:hypothetical protein
VATAQQLSAVNIAFNTAFNTGVGAAYTRTVVATAFPWTTGTATVTARHGPYQTIMKLRFVPESGPVLMLLAGLSLLALLRFTHRFKES